MFIFRNILFYKKCIFFCLLCLLSFCGKSQTQGCTDSQAINFDDSATENDGSCIYDPVSVTTTKAIALDAIISETSGLIFWNNQLFTHNDSEDTTLYVLDPTNGNILDVHPIPNVENKDWEAISQDGNFIYIGNFGNNEAGNRTDLKIYRIDKVGLLNGAPQVEIIGFAYEDQTDFSEKADNATDFDCEAFIVSEDSIYLFTKQWITNKSAIYSIPKAPGNYQARFRGLLDTNGMVTGATYLENEGLVVLCGYSNSLQPFLFLLYDFEEHDFLSGNKRKLDVALPFHQIEGIATKDGKKYYLTNEHFKQGSAIETFQQLHLIDLSEYLGVYLSNKTFKKPKSELSIYPNPSTDTIFITSDTSFVDADFEIYTQTGKSVLRGKLMGNNASIAISTLGVGLYYLKIEGRGRYVFKVVKK